MARVSLRTAESSMFLPVRTVSDASGLCRCNIKVPFVVWELTVKGAYLNCSRFTGCLDFQLHFQNCISKNSFMKSADEKIIFINIYDLCKN